LGVWEVTRKGVRVTTIEVPAGFPVRDAEELARSAMARLKAEDEAMPADWSCGPVEYYVDEERMEMRNSLTVSELCPKTVS
jgi:hypothetical protein